MKIVLSHPTGNANVRNALRALRDSDRLAEFHTTVATFDGTIFGALSRLPVGAALKRRRYDQDLIELTRTRPFKEIIRILALKYGYNSLIDSRTGRFSIEAVYKQIDRFTADRIRSDKIADANAVYCYENGAMHAFAAAKDRGLHCIYELPIGYWRTARRILTEEAELRPDWAATLRMLDDADDILEQKDIELQNADTVIVASQFTADTLNDAPFQIQQPVTISYGCGTLPTRDASPQPTGEKVRVLYVGGLSQRKGIAYLLDAVQKVETAVELTIVGRRLADCEVLDTALKKYRWIESLPHDEVLREMRAHDVFVFPSLFEGFGLVLTEALSQGIPIITTSHTAGPEIINDGQEGFIVPIRDSDTIAEKLMFLRDHPEQLQAMKKAALLRAGEITWQGYRDRLNALIETTFSQER